MGGLHSFITGTKAIREGNNEYGKRKSLPTKKTVYTRTIKLEANQTNVRFIKTKTTLKKNCGILKVFK